MTRSFRTLLSCAIVAVTAGTAMARVFVLPHVLEKSGRISNTQYTFDTTIYATYGRGLTDGKVGKGASASLYLYDASGSPLRAPAPGGNVVCNPCGPYLLAGGGGGGGVVKKIEITVDDLIVAAGGFGAPPNDTVSGFGVLVVDGDDKNVALQGFVVNSHTSAFDLSYQKIEFIISK